MTFSRLNRKQRLAVWSLLVVLFFCLTIGSWWMAGVAIIVAAVVVWKLAGAVERPEIAVVKSVRCGGCGAIGEPHWKSCPRCGAANWV
jgi:hypothetical protein